MKTTTQTLETVRQYYGKILKTNKDLQTSACCTAESIPTHLREVVKEIHPEVQERFYGCGSPIPSELDGCTVLDLGCGSGRDCYLLSKLVGERGKVIGIDMTAEQLHVAQKHQEFHARKFGFNKSNVQFVNGYIEDLETAGIATHSVDAVISNCVINLSPDKKRVFSEIFRVLKPGGEIYFSDVFSSRRIPSALASDPLLLGECLGGALYIEDFRRLLQSIGCNDYRVVRKNSIELRNPEVVRKAGMIDFYSMTVRAFKLDLEDRCEDYGQVAFYRGTIPECPHEFQLDDHHLFGTGMPLLVCGNTAAMVRDSRYGVHFDVIGDASTHYGLFDCGPTAVLKSNSGSGPSGACC